MAPNHATAGPQATYCPISSPAPEQATGGPQWSQYSKAPWPAPILEHLGSAHTEAELAALMRIGQDKLHLNQPALELPTTAGVQAGAAVVQGKVSRLLIEVIRGSWDRLGFAVIADEAFFQLLLARLVEPTSKLDSLRVVGELGMDPVHLSTIKRCLKRCAAKEYREQIAQACFTHVWARHGGDVSLLLYDLSWTSLVP